MRGGERRRKERWEQALFTAYYAGLFSQADWKKTPSFEELTQPRQSLTNEEIAERFATLARQSDVD